MKKIFLFFILAISYLCSDAQLRPSTIPNPNSTGYGKTGYSQADSGFLWGIRDTFPAAKPTTIWHSDGNFYKTIGGAGAHWSLWVPTSPGTVSLIATNNGTGIYGGTITSTGTLYIDTNQISTHAWNKKGNDSIVGLISALVTGVSSVSTVSQNRILVTPTTGSVTVDLATNPIVSGTLSATGVISTGQITAIGLNGTITTAAQPNITLVGTLSALTVTTSISGAAIYGSGRALSGVVTDVRAGSGISVSSNGGVFTVTSTSPGGTVTNVSANLPISVTNPTTTPNITIDTTNSVYGMTTLYQNSKKLNAADTSKYARTVGWCTVEQYGGGLGGDDIIPMRNMMAACDRVWLYGNISISDTLAIRNSQVIHGNGGNLIQTTAGKSIFTANSVDGWSIDGQLTLQSTGAAVGAVAGVSVRNARYWSVTGINIKSIPGYGIRVFPGGSARGNGGIVSGNQIYDNYIGLQVDAGNGAEYTTYTDNNFHGNTYAGNILAGNVIIANSNFDENTNGVRVGGNYGTNNAHGMIIGCNFNHNTNYALYLDSVQYGQTIVGCHFYGDITNGITIGGSSSASFLGGIIDCRITMMDATAKHFFANMELDGSFNVSGSTTSAIFQGCFQRPGGLYAGNTPIDYLIGTANQATITKPVGSDSTVVSLPSSVIVSASLSSTLVYGTTSVNGGIAKLSPWSANTLYARFGHSSFDGSSNYGFLQNNAGESFMDGTQGYLQTGGITRAIVTSAGISATGIISSGNVTLTNTYTSIDTTTYKPLSYDASGNIVKLTYWPGSGGGTSLFALSSNVISPVTPGNSITTTGNIAAANITATGNVSAASLTVSGAIKGGNLSIIGDGTNSDIVTGVLQVYGSTIGASIRLLRNSYAAAGLFIWNNATTVGLWRAGMPANTGRFVIEKGQTSSIYPISIDSASLQVSLGSITPAVITAGGALSATNVASSGDLSAAGNITSTTLSATGTVTGGTFNGAGTGLTGTAATLNIGGNAATANTAVSATTAGSAGTASIVTAAAQPNITILGILTALSVSGGETVGGNFSATGSVTAANIASYSEGTFTPTLTAQTSGTVTLSVASGKWVKQGNQVSITMYLALSATSAPLGEIRAGGLPFTNANNNYNFNPCYIRANGTGATTGSLQGYSPKNTTFIVVETLTAGTATSIAALLTSSTELMISMTYFTN